MSNHDTSFGLSDHGHGIRCDRWVLAIVAVSLALASGCGLGQSVLLPKTSIQIISGKDSAGAIIELEKRGDDFTRARVIDVILGTGVAEIMSDKNGHVEFTIDFPAGATITYFGTVQDPGASSAQAIAGTWTQHSVGIFGSDYGTWSATAGTTDK